ncbi:hypothetical protein J6590_071475, partial [Homalodisca vitripennis]
TAPCPSKFKLQLSVTVRERCGYDGLVSVWTWVFLQVENCAAIISPYDGQHTVRRVPLIHHADIHLILVVQTWLTRSPRF